MAAQCPKAARLATTQPVEITLCILAPGLQSTVSAMLRSCPGILVFALAGCTFSSGTDGVGADASVFADAGAADAALSTGGLSLTFRSTPALPGEVEVADGHDGDDDDDDKPLPLRIDSASLALGNVRAIGDSAPGDERTTAPTLSVSWPNPALSPVQFERAPPGLYARVLGTVTSLHIEGGVQSGGVWRPFVIDDRPVRSFAAEMDAVELEPAGSAVLEVEVRLDSAGLCGAMAAARPRRRRLPARPREPGARRAALRHRRCVPRHRGRDR